MCSTVPVFASYVLGGIEVNAVATVRCLVF